MTSNQINECCKIFLQYGLSANFKEVLQNFKNEFAEMLDDSNVNLVRNLFICYISSLKVGGSQPSGECSQICETPANCEFEQVLSEQNCEFVCEICEKQFASQNGLNAHKKKHK